VRSSLKYYLIISTIVHLFLFVLFEKSEYQSEKISFNSGGSSVELMISSEIDRAKDYGKSEFNKISHSYISAGIEEFRKVVKYNEPPRYPLIALRNGWNGKVVLKFLVSKSGQLDRVSVFKSSGFKALDQAALDSARNWRFVNGVNNIMVEYPVRFVIN